MSAPDSEKWAGVKQELIARITNKEDFVRAVFSGRRRHHQPPAERIDLRPVLIKDELLLQTQERQAERVLTKNYAFGEFEQLELLEAGFANFLVESRNESFEVRVGKRDQVFSKTARVNLEPSYEHDHKKDRFLDENDPLLIAVGISDATGRIKPSMRDKYLQVEEFLRVLDKSCAVLEPAAPIRLVDLGCGHAYLTFAAFRFFQFHQRAVSFIGVDLRGDTRIRNEKIALELGIASDVCFIDSPIADLPIQGVDIAIALHACDTATDDALSWAVAAGAKVILAAPCCHHELQRQVRRGPDPLGQIFEHGILAERQMDLLTDALRATLLDVTGYKSEVFEFISGDHTARNLMIRAVLDESRLPNKPADARVHGKLREYRHTCELWGIKPALEARLKLGGFLPTD